MTRLKSVQYHYFTPKSFSPLPKSSVSNDATPRPPHAPRPLAVCIGLGRTDAMVGLAILAGATAGGGADHLGGVGARAGGRDAAVEGPRHPPFGLAAGYHGFNRPLAPQAGVGWHRLPLRHWQWDRDAGWSSRSDLPLDPATRRRPCRVRGLVEAAQ